MYEVSTLQSMSMYVGLLLLPYNARCAGGVPERAGGRDVGGRVVGYMSLGL